MPRLARYFIKAGFVYLAMALLLGALLVALPVIDVPAQISAFQPVYFHLLMVGWVTQLIIGVAYWMFPKYSREQPRRSETLGWAVFILLNTGLVLRFIGEPLLALQPESGLGWLLVLSALCQLVAGWGFVVNTWARVKER